MHISLLILLFSFVFGSSESLSIDNYGHVEINSVDEAESATLNNILDTSSSNGCECHDFTCGCCGHLEEHKIHLNTTLCTNITYLNEDYGISFTVTWDGVTIYNETVSARNPPPYCVGAPYVADLADVCLRLHDVDASKHRLHACVEVEARLHKVLISKYELGCFTIGHDAQPHVVIV